MTTPRGIRMCIPKYLQGFDSDEEYTPLKLDAQVVPAQGTVFVTGGQGGKGRKGAKYLQDSEWNALSPEAKSKNH
jgi:hypothetical protein